jgi:hypothetical protein
MNGPSPEVRREIEQSLIGYSGRVADTFRVMQEQNTSAAQEIFEAGGAGNARAARNNLEILRALLDGALPRSPSMTGQAASAIRSFQRRRGQALSREAREYLAALVDRLSDAAGDRAAVELEAQRAEVASEALVARTQGRAGVYVYTYSHYNKFPYVVLSDADDTELFLMKIGFTETQGDERIKAQQSSTAVPEPILHLRFYEAGPGTTARDLETKFHRLLDLAGHPRSFASTRREWFATNVFFLDAIAETLGLTINYIETETS